MITLQLPPSTTKSAQAGPPSQANPAAPGANTEAGATDPLTFAMVLAQQAVLSTSSGLGKGSAQEEAAVDTNEAAAVAAPVTPWIWLPPPAVRDAVAAAPPAVRDAVAAARPAGPGKDLLSEIQGAAAGPSPDKAKAVAETLAGVPVLSDTAIQPLAGDARPPAGQAQPAMHVQSQTPELQAPRPVPVAGKITISSDVGTPRWEQDIRQNISLLVQSRTAVAELRLTPADMGPIQIRIDFSDTQPSVSISVQQADTRNALDAALPRLRDMLAESGVTLGGASVEQHSGGAGDPARDPARYAGQPAGHAPDSAATVEPPSATRVISLDQLVDTYA